METIREGHEGVEDLIDRFAARRRAAKRSISTR